MKVRKETKVQCANSPSAIILAMLDAEVPGDAKVTKVETMNFYGSIGADSVSSYATVTPGLEYTFVWYREEGREESIEIRDLSERKRII